ncbi:BETAA-AD [Symbiodinium sp. KB8]|nr:BETAA-AD [Symbiodinium sp. KB8]
MTKDNKKKRDVIKKVIAYMTLGIDVSRLYSEMVKISKTTDPVIKKMVYLYLCSYAATHPDLTLLAINTLQSDCQDDDPMVRGLALRSLCSLRLESILEYVMRPLEVSGTAMTRPGGAVTPFPWRFLLSFSPCEPGISHGTDRQVCGIKARMCAAQACWAS